MKGKRQFNPSSSSLTNSQAKEFAIESKVCSDGYPCGEPESEHEDCYCDDCPNNQKEENKMTGKQFKQNRSHPAAALAEQIDSEQKKYQEATVGDLLDILDNEQKWFALGYLSAQLVANK